MGATTADYGAWASAAAYRLLFEESPQPALIVDRGSLDLVRANNAAAVLYGYPLEELVHLPLPALWPRAAELLGHGAAVGSSAQAREPVTWRHFRKDGTPIEVTVKVQELSFSARPALGLHVNAVSEPQFAAAVLQAQRRLLEMVARGHRLARVLEELVLAMERLSGEMIGSVVLLEEDGRRARQGAAPSLPQTYWRAAETLTLGPKAGSCGTAMFLNQPVVSEDIATDPLWTDYREHALSHGLRACWATPIRSHSGKVLGSFAMYYRRPGPPPVQDRNLVEAATDLAAIAIEREQADRLLEQSEARLRAIIDHVPAVVTLKDVEGRYVLVNRRFEQVTAIAARAVLGRADWQLFAAPLADAYSANDREVLEKRRGIEFEQELPQADGLHVHLAVKFPLLHPGGTAYGIGAFLCDITERKYAERALERSREELRVLAARLQSAREEERARISREVHDELGQMLAALQMSHSVLLRSVRRDAPEAERLLIELGSMQQIMEQMLASVRRIATQLRPEALDKLGLAAAIEWQAAEFTKQTGIPCRALLPEAAVPADPERATAFFRILQEALTNVARHAEATEVQVELRLDGAFLEMNVADNGRGIAAAAPGSAGSLGLLGMRERAAALGGTVTVASPAGAGTRLTARIPLQSE